MEPENDRELIETDRELIEIHSNSTVIWKIFTVKLLAICCLPFIWVLMLLILSILSIFALIAGVVFILFRFGQ
jgi:Flp pilus assembly protein TadB